MEHILNIEKQADKLKEVFSEIQKSNTILFLGAGASVGEKRYLSKELIEYYENINNLKMGEVNIKKWIDYLSADEDFSRADFDNFVVERLHQLNTTEGHKIMAGIPWREIITTNYDLLVEKAFDETSGSTHKLYDLKIIRNKNQYNYKASNSELKYIKLNGCIQDKSLYPLAFSTDDFNRIKPFYKAVLNDLKNLSPKISFLSIGYSFSDDFGKELLDIIDSYNFRDNRWIFNVDPYPNESALSYYKKKKTCIIKCSFQDFFNEYKKWELFNGNFLVKKRGLALYNRDDYNLSASPKLILNLDGIVQQLNTHTRGNYIKEEEFYRGEEPTFNLILRNVDVVKTKLLDSFISQIEDVLQNKKHTFIPVFFNVGDFGIGKSTFALRLIYELEKRADLDLIAFEIIDYNNVRKEDLIELIKVYHVKNFLLLCDEIEVESHFKSLLDIQSNLSIEQFQNTNVFILAPIRLNIYEKIRQRWSVPNSHELIMTSKFQNEEIDELLDKLKSVGLVQFRDAREKRKLIDKIENEYNSDSFVTLMSTVTSGRHVQDLISCYNELTDYAKQAFLYTALLHKYKLLMPAAWLKQNIAMDWDEFIEKIVSPEGNGILIQEYVASRSTQPDLYFRTKHPLIAEKLISIFVPNMDKQFNIYNQMLKKIEPGQTNSYLVHNLLKAFTQSGDFTANQMNTFFNSAYTGLKNDPYFLLNYVINLQNNKTKETLKRAIDLINYAETLLEYRNHKFVHRKAVLKFELAKLYYDEKDYDFVMFYLKEAIEFFEIKKLLDPFSSFSYVDYIRLLIWELEYMYYDIEDKLEKRILIEDLFELANKSVVADYERIEDLRMNYARFMRNASSSVDYHGYLLQLYEDYKLRPYACVLLYMYYSEKSDSSKCNELLLELEYLSDNFIVVKFLFRVYGQNLHIANNRIKLMNMAANYTTLEKLNPLRFNYFMFIAESYNYNYHAGREYLNQIKLKYYNLNPEYDIEWKDPNGVPIIFEATVTADKSGKYKTVKIASTQHYHRLIKGNYDQLAIGAKVNVRLHFFLYGLLAEIIQIL